MNAFDLAKTHKWNMPTVCPACGVNLEVDSSGFLFCPNISCSKKTLHNVMKLSNKWNILELGPRVTEDFIKSANIKSLHEFLHNIDNPKLDEICGKNADKIRKNLKNAMGQPRSLANFLSAFDMEGYGERKIQTLVDAGYNTVESFFNKANPRDISNINGWSLDSGVDFLRKISELKEDILDIAKLCKIEEKKIVEGGKFSGLSFCFTGPNDFRPEEKRKLLEEKVVSLGGVIDSVKKGLSYLVSSETGTAKMQKAEKNNVTVISYEDFYKLLGE